MLCRSRQARNQLFLEEGPSAVLLVSGILMLKALELEETIKREQKLRKALEEKEAERDDIEEKYSSLQEEATGKTRKLRKVWSAYQAVKGELADTQVKLHLKVSAK